MADQIQFSASGFATGTSPSYTFRLVNPVSIIPSSGTGTEGTNYDTTSFDYDDMRRRNQTTSPGGTTWADADTVRQTSIGYDFRNRQIWIVGEENAYSETLYDNLNRPIRNTVRHALCLGNAGECRV